MSPVERNRLVRHQTERETRLQPRVRNTETFQETLCDQQRRVVITLSTDISSPFLPFPENVSGYCRTGSARSPPRAGPITRPTPQAAAMNVIPLA